MVGVTTRVLIGLRATITALEGFYVAQKRQTR